MENLGERHLQYFGTIVQWFARYEFLMQEIMAKLAGTDAASILQLTEEMEFDAKRQALLKLLRHQSMPLDRFDRICAYLLVPYTFIQLRHDIIHSTWVPSRAPDSIQPNWVLQLPPGVIPWRQDPRMTNEGSIERKMESTAFSLDDLNEIIDNLATNFISFSAYLREIGL